jgi:hypothetical protein
LFTNIAIVAQKSSEVQTLRGHLRNPMRHTVREFLSIDEVKQGLGSFPFDVLIMRLDSFERQHVKMIQKARACFHYASLITVSSFIDPTARFEVKEIPRHRLLLEPMELEDLSKVIEKFMRKEPSAARLHPRVLRDGACELVNPERGERIAAKFVDFAQMGTRVLVNPRVPLKRNGRYELHYRSTTEPNHMHKIATNVIWAEISSGMMGTIMRGPQQLVGLRFIATL